MTITQTELATVASAFETAPYLFSDHPILWLVAAVFAFVIIALGLIVAQFISATRVMPPQDGANADPWQPDERNIH